MKSRLHSGVIFLSLLLCLPVTAQVVTIQHSFSDTPDGASPLGLTLSGGLLYGSTSSGGSSGNGSLFLFDTNSLEFSTFYSFTGDPSNGQSPNDVLVAGAVIYGTTTYGGTNNFGGVYSVGTNGLGFTSLYSFGDSPDGATPLGQLVLSAGTLYGTTRVGGAGTGATDGGTIFAINTNGGGYQILYSFTNTPDGAQPQSGLVLGGATLYGTTSGGGAYGNGTIFAINTNRSSYTNLYSFTNAPDAVRPYGALVLSAGVLYGAGSGGGTNNTGAIFAINTNGTGYRVLYSFSGFGGNTDGEFPESPLTFSGSCLYGSTISGGTGGGGTVFLINTNGTGFTVLSSFTNGAPAGSVLMSGVVRAGNAVWGTAYSGGSGGGGTLFDLPMPALTLQPQSVTATNTSPASFTAGAADDRPFAYQWFYNTNTLLNAQTNNTLAFGSVSTLNAGTYTVVVSDNLGSVTSSPAVLTVIVPGVKPAITLQPQDYTVIASNTASFTNAATGTAPLSYQWYFNTNTLLSGQTGAILVLPSATTNQAGYYTVIVTNLYGSATSSPATLTVITIVAPAITQQPQNFTVTNGYTAAFTNVATGTAPLFYQWYFNTHTPVNGATGPVLTLSPATTNSAGYYTVVVTNAAGSITSAPALLTVIVPVTPPVITQQPQNCTVTNGYNAAFTNAASSTVPFSYQWYFNTNTPVSGGTNGILVVPFVATNQAGSYTAVVSNSVGSVTSSPATLTVISTKPLIFGQPQPMLVTNGETFSFTVIAAGQSLLTYQWYTNLVAPGYSLRGSTNSTVSLTASAKLAGNYLVVVANSLGKATSNPALLTVASTPVITQNPQPLTVTNGDPATFTAAAFGPGALGYQWLFQTNVLVAGATNMSLLFTNAITNLAGYYAMRVTNSFGSVTSSYALLTVKSALNFLSYDFNLASGSASFAIANVAKSTNRLWASSNLAAPWFPIATNVMATNGLWFYTDTGTARTNAVRLYRFSTP
jgi:uncharacterized repeat protein (TIGR03803 family)